MKKIFVLVSFVVNLALTACGTSVPAQVLATATATATVQAIATVPAPTGEVEITLISIPLEVGTELDKKVIFEDYLTNGINYIQFYYRGEKMILDVFGNHILFNGDQLLPGQYEILTSSDDELIKAFLKSAFTIQE